MNKKLATVASMAVTALMLGACGTAGPSESTVTATSNALARADTPETSRASETSRATYVKPTPTVSAEERTKQAYYRTLKKEGIYLDDLTAYQAAMTTCEFIETGHSVEGLFHEMATDQVLGRVVDPVLPGISDDDLPFIMGAAVGAFCPEYGDEFQ